MAHQAPIDRRLRRHRIEAFAAQLMTDRARTPARMVVAHLDDARLDHRRHLMRTRRRARRPVHQADDSLVRVLAQPPMDGLAAHPIAGGDADHRRPVEHLMHRRHPLIHDPQLHQHDRPPAPRRSGSAARQPRRCHTPAGPTVTQQPDPLSPSYRTRVREVSPTYRSRCVNHEPEPHTCLTLLGMDFGMETAWIPCQQRDPEDSTDPLTCRNTRLSFRWTPGFALENHCGASHPGFKSQSLRHVSREGQDRRPGPRARSGAHENSVSPT